MRHYRLVDQVTFGPGTVLGLSAAQLERRKHVRTLEPVDGGHVAIGPVYFKAGDVVGLQGELPRALVGKALLIEGDAADASPEPAAAPKKPAAKQTRKA
jgi:hypothetical protein